MEVGANNLVSEISFLEHPMTKEDGFIMLLAEIKAFERRFTETIDGGVARTSKVFRTDDFEMQLMEGLVFAGEPIYDEEIVFEEGPVFDKEPSDSRISVVLSDGLDITTTEHARCSIGRDGGVWVLVSADTTSASHMPSSTSLPAHDASPSLRLYTTELAALIRCSMFGHHEDDWDPAISSIPSTPCIASTMSTEAKDALATPVTTKELAQAMHTKCSM